MSGRCCRHEAPSSKLARRSARPTKTATTLTWSRYRSSRSAFRAAAEPVSGPRHSYPLGTIKADAAGFRPAAEKNVVLQVAQQTTIDFTLHPLGLITTVEVTTAAPLLDTENASLGTDVTNEYVRNIPLYGRSMFGLVFLAGGVTENTRLGITAH